MKKRANPVKSHQGTLIVAGLATLAGFMVPGLQKLLLPLQYLNTHLHEFSHALVALLTGAKVEEIVVKANGSGLTPVEGGNILLIASAGYMGASCFGAGMIVAGRTENGARRTLILLASILALSTLMWVRGDTVGLASGVGWAIALAVFGVLLRGRVATFVVQFIGIQQCLNSVTSVFALVQITASTEVNSDASIMQSATGIPSVLWALGWSAFSLALVGWTLRASWKASPGRAG